MALTEKKPFERLPVDVVPINYKLELQPDLDTFKFRGKLEITVQVMLVQSLHIMIYQYNSRVWSCVCALVSRLERLYSTSLRSMRKNDSDVAYVIIVWGHIAGIGL